jgi:hypothetical protein
MIDDRLSEELNALVDGELAEERANELRTQLESDAELRAEFDRLRRVADLVKALPPARAHLLDDVMANLPPRGRVLRPWGWLAGIAAAAAAIVVAVTLWEQEPVPNDTWTEAKGPGPVRARPTEFDKKGGAGAEKARGTEAKLSRRESEEPSTVAPVVDPGDIAATDPGAREKAGRDRGEASTAEADAAPEPSRKEPDEGVTAPQAPGSAVAPDGGVEVPDLLGRVEGRGAPLTASERGSYLKAMRALDDKALRAHLARVGAGRSLPRRQAKSKSSDPGYEFDLVAIDASDAGAVREALAHAFRAEGGAAKGVAPSALKAEARDAAGGVLQYEWNATPEQAGTLASWLERLGLLPAAGRGAVKPSRLRITGDFEETGKRQPAFAVRVRIRYRDPSAGPSRSDDK